MNRAVRLVRRSRPLTGRGGTLLETFRTRDSEVSRVSVAVVTLSVKVSRCMNSFSTVFAVTLVVMVMIGSLLGMVVDRVNSGASVTVMVIPICVASSCLLNFGRASR